MKKYVPMENVPWVRVPWGKNDRHNSKKRQLEDLGLITEEDLEKKWKLSAQKYILFSGRPNKTYYILKYFIQSESPTLLICKSYSCSKIHLWGASMFSEWQQKQLGSSDIFSGNGILNLENEEKIKRFVFQVENEKNLTAWSKVNVILLLEDGLALNSRLFRIFQSSGRFFILAENLMGAVEENSLSVSSLMGKMDVIIAETLGNSVKDFVEILPRFSYC